MISVVDYLKDNSYPGRGVLIGTTSSHQAVFAYFIMGRSENSRNRIFVKENDDVMIHPYDVSKVEDPSLIIYAPVRTLKDHVIVTNGDQTDTVKDFILENKSFNEALLTRTYEPDAPNFTPRISGMISYTEDSFIYQLNILKRVKPDHTARVSQTYQYEPINGMGHIIHTYEENGNPLPSFNKTPVEVAINDDIDVFANGLYEALNHDNRISLYVRYIDLKTKTYQERMFNRMEEK